MVLLVVLFLSQAAVFLALVHFVADYFRYRDQFPRLANIALPPVLLAEKITLPSLAVIVPARDEESRIHICLRSLAASENLSALKIYAVNDRSKDSTPALMQEEAQRTQPGRIEVVNIDTLPNGWLGKNNACWVGAQKALSQAPQPKYLLFADGDVVFHPQALAQAMTHMENQNLDFLTAFPKSEYRGLWEAAFLIHFGFMVGFFSRPWALTRPGGRNFLGMGVLLMVRADAYQKLGGHQPLRFEVSDDMKLALLFRSRGYRCGAVSGVGRLQLRWQNGFWASLKGLVKNGFAAHEYSVLQLAASTIVSMILFVTPWVCFALTPVHMYLGTLAASNLLILLVLYLKAGHESHTPGFVGFILMPFSAMAVAITFIISAIMTIYKGGIQWRDCFYVLSDLKRHCFTQKKAFAQAKYLKPRPTSS